MKTRIVGTNVPRKEALPKLRGEARYLDDLYVEDMWHGATVRSTIARGLITDIEFGREIPWHEFCIVTADDIPGRNMVPMFLEDQPLLVPTGKNARVNHPEEPILLLAHPDKERLPAAVAAVRITYKELPAIFDMEESIALKEVIWGAGITGPGASPNMFKSFLLEHGDLDEAFARADLIVEGEYHTGAQEQLYIEPNGALAQATRNADGSVASVTVTGSLQCPFYVHRALKVAFSLGDDQVRVIQAETGGAFGGKEDYPSILCGHAALLALKCGHSVKMVYDRAEDMAATTKRHPSRVRHRTAVTRDGLRWARRSISRSTAVRMRRCRRRSARARRSTRLALTSGLPFGSVPVRLPQILLHQARFAVSALRKVCSRSSVTWTRSRGPAV
jgi:CO/xanthine dehydrogenase Mo-binding subunit